MKASQYGLPLAFSYIYVDSRDLVACVFSNQVTITQFASYVTKSPGVTPEVLAAPPHSHLNAPGPPVHRPEIYHRLMIALLAHL
jgi:hypothetical protein